MITLFNTLKRAKQRFVKENQKVKLYTCGPTVYDFAHIGNLRTYVAEDIIKKVFLYAGYDVDHVMNITDIDDKTIKRANAMKVSLEEYTQTYTQAFLEDLEALGIQKPSSMPKATDYIDQMIQMIQVLLDQGHAYCLDGSVYFKIDSFKEYGKLSHLKLDELESGAGHAGHADEYDKESVSDFVLWKAYDPKRDESIFYESPFGRGRPGWHLECSAMAHSLLGDTLDIHMGGVDNIFPHHENEIAQSECCFKAPFVRYWMHVEHLMVEGKKMSKSLGNFYTFKDLLEKGFSGREVRYLLASVHYRSSLNFTLEGLKGAQSALERIDDCIDSLKQINKQDSAIEIKENLKEAKKLFEEALFDDFNVSKALSVLFEIIRFTNQSQSKLSKDQADQILKLIQEFDQVFGFCFKQKQQVPQRILDLLDRRISARKEKNFALADQLRDAILNEGYLIEDTPSGARVKKR